MGYDKLSPTYLMNFPEIGKVMKQRVVKFPLAGLMCGSKHTSDIMKLKTAKLL